MISIENILQLLAGLSIFVYAMLLLEESLKKLAGRTFKLFLKKYTNTRLGAILSGAMVTGILQSSSVVSMITLSFVGAGILSMRNAMAVVIGSNLGITIDSWIVALLGFKADFGKFSALILIASVIGLVFFSNRKTIKRISGFALGIGFLFLGLEFMKDSMGSLVGDFSQMINSRVSTFGFIIAGFIVTAVIQSSSVTMVIVLSGLHSNALLFENAVAIIIGSELGTTLKIILGALKGMPAKKRVALGNFIFNLLIVALAFIFLHPIINLITKVFGIEDYLIGLVLFQSLMNFIGILIFFPFFNFFTNFLERFFKKKQLEATYFISNDRSNVEETAVEMYEKEAFLFICRAILLNANAFDIHKSEIEFNESTEKIINELNENLSSYNEKYDNVKQAEGKILSCYNKLNESELEPDEIAALTRMINAVRNAMYSAKGIKDLEQDRSELKNSVSDIKFEEFHALKAELLNFYKELLNVLDKKEQTVICNELIKLMDLISRNYELRIANIYKQSAESLLKDKDVSTLLNINREVYSSCKAMINSLKEFLLNAEHIKQFENMPITVIS